MLPLFVFLIQRINNVQSHRGPDSDGIHLEPGLALGHRRLSVIDLSTGQQPLFNHDRSVAIVFNGEIYNFQQLVPELQSLGYRFATRSDTEVIVHAWEAWGPECVHRLRGMFAFALWDRNQQTLFLARDRMGVKPMHYAWLADGTFIFGSELKVITAHPGFARDIDPLAVEDYFSFGYVPDPRCIYRNAHKLPSAHTLTLRRGDAAQAQPVPYWNVHFSNDNPINQADAEAELRDRVRESVKLRLKADVPLGAFLSGGVDSSAVVATMAGLSTTPVHTCAIGFDDPRFNESAFAQQVADRYQTDHRLEVVKSDDFDLIDTLAWLYDEPYADSSAIPTYRVCQLARKQVTVALSGDGGDESFGGYRRYRLHMMEEKLRAQAEAKDLEKYRSEFFGRLSQLLAGREGVRVVGDRFVFSSEVLFDPGRATLAPEGKAQIASVVQILDDVAGEIPPSLDWIIRVDGHTDDVPLSGLGEYADNWELSQARALSVVRVATDERGRPAGSTVTPSSQRSRFSSRIFIEYGRRLMSKRWPSLARLKMV